MPQLCGIRIEGKKRRWGCRPSYFFSLSPHIDVVGCSHFSWKCGTHADNIRDFPRAVLHSQCRLCKSDHLRVKGRITHAAPFQTILMLFFILKNGRMRAAFKKKHARFKVVQVMIKFNKNLDVNIESLLPVVILVVIDFFGIKQERIWSTFDCSRSRKTKVSIMTGRLDQDLIIKLTATARTDGLIQQVIWQEKSQARVGLCRAVTTLHPLHFIQNSRRQNPNH